MEDGKSSDHDYHDSNGSSWKPKVSKRGVILVPQPSDDARDPLNWPMSKKIITLSIVTCCSFIGIAQAVANQAGYVPQSELYHKSTTQLSYSISAAIAGLASGPVLLWAPMSRIFGRTSCIFWGMIITLFMNVWSSQMQAENDYIPFIISKWLGGTFGSVASAIGGGTIVDIFFLHQRGKAFAAYQVLTLFGTRLGGTFSGFIVNFAPWPVQFYWVIGAEALLIILVFLFLEDTGYDRDNGKGTPQPPKSTSFVSNRIATLLPGNKVVVGPRDIYTQTPLATIMIGLAPVTLIAGIFILIAFGWTVAVTTLLSVFLQTPVADGGYGFTPLRNGYFTFSQWVAIIAAEAYGALVNDRVPLWACRRKGGVWRPELRLYPLMWPHIFFLPVGLGIVGAALQYHLHYMVLALGVFLLDWSETVIVPMIVNYVSEGFTEYAAEVTAALNLYRLILGLTVPFFIQPWTLAVGRGWVFGMQAFFTILAFGLTGVLYIFGPQIRKMSFGRFRHSEEGQRLL